MPAFVARWKYRPVIHHFSRRIQACLSCHFSSRCTFAEAKLFICMETTGNPDGANNLYFPAEFYKILVLFDPKLTRVSQDTFSHDNQTATVSAMLGDDACFVCQKSRSVLTIDCAAYLDDVIEVHHALDPHRQSHVTFIASSMLCFEFQG